LNVEQPCEVLPILVRFRWDAFNICLKRLDDILVHDLDILFLPLADQEVVYVFISQLEGSILLAHLVQLLALRVGLLLHTVLPK
jgi:hypothetical protein